MPDMENMYRVRFNSKQHAIRPNAAADHKLANFPVESSALFGERAALRKVR